MSVILASTQHDPDGRLYEQTTRMLPLIAELFDGLAIYATRATQAQSLAPLAHVGALIGREPPESSGGLVHIGQSRRGALALALQLEASFILFCDFDRLLHWAEHWPEELAQVVARIAAYDFTVLGRTTRAFDSHPRVQRDTEAIINHVYASVSGQAWDVTAAARGLSAAAARAVLAGCPEQTIGTDTAWPLFIQRSRELSLGYIAVEGLEFETADRYGDLVAAAGGLEHWIAQIDADPHGWVQRLEVARAEVAAMLPYTIQ